MIETAYLRGPSCALLLIDMSLFISAGLVGSRKESHHSKNIRDWKASDVEVAYFLAYFFFFFRKVPILTEELESTIAHIVTIDPTH